MTTPTTSNISNEKCGQHVYWWDGEYDGDCELPKGHLEPFHYDGISYFDDDNNSRDEEQQNLVRYIQQEKSALLNELLSQREDFLEPDTDDKEYIEAIPVSVIEAKLKELS